MSKKLLTALLSTVYKMGTEEIAESLKDSDLPETSNMDDDFIKLVIDKDKEKVQAFKEDRKKYRDFGHADGVKSAMTKAENDLRAEYGIDSEGALKGSDLIKAIVASAIEKGGGKTKVEVNDDVIKKSALYLSIENKLKQREAEFATEKEGAIQSIHAEYKGKETQRSIRNKALAILDTLNPVLSADASKASKIKDLFLNDLTSATKFDIAENGDILLLDENGQPQTDGHGFTATFDAFVQDTAKNYFDLNTSQERKAPGNGGTKPGEAGKQSAGGNKTLPQVKTLTELAEAMNSSDYSGEEKQNIFSAWEAANPNG